MGGASLSMWVRLLGEWVWFKAEEEELVGKELGLGTGILEIDRWLGWGEGVRERLSTWKVG